MAVIYCFTSTGNSLCAARKIADAIGAKVMPVAYEQTTTDEDVIGFVFPIFFWGLPNMVRHFARNLKITNPDAYVFAVATYGSAAPGAVSEINKYLRGHRLSYAASIKSVENYLPMYELGKVDEGIEAAEQSIQVAAHDIKERKQKGGGLFWLPNHIIKMTFPGKRGDCDSKFTVSDSCTGCGNIRLIVLTHGHIDHGILPFVLAVG